MQFARSIGDLNIGYTIIFKHVLQVSYNGMVTSYQKLCIRINFL